MSMMNSHVCQCDEPEKINAELLKTLISEARTKCRRFHEQQPRHLTNMAKLILTLNDGINMRSDAGVITRLKYCIRATHRFKTLIPSTFDASVDFNSHSSSPSVSYQFARRCFPQGVNYEQFCTGLYLIIEHFGLSFCTYDSETVFLPVDVASSNVIESEKPDPLRLRWWSFRYGLTTKITSLVRKRTNDGESVEFDESNDDWDDSTIHGGLRSDELTRTTMLDPNEEFDASYDRSETQHETVIATSSTVNSVDEEIVNFVTNVRDSFNSSRTNLEDPIVIANIPTSVREDAMDLHVSIDPYQMMLKHFKVIETSNSTSMNEITLTNFFKSFLNTYGCDVTKGTLKDTVGRMRNRLKTDFPHVFDKSKNLYHVLFVPK